MNLARHLGLLSWAVAAKAPVFLYGFVVVLVMIPNLPQSEFGIYALVFQFFIIISLLVKFLVLHPMIKYASPSTDFSRYVRAGMFLSAALYIIIGIIVWVTAPISAEILRISARDIRIVPLLMMTIFMREIGFSIQQIRLRTKRIFYLEAVYYAGSAIGLIALRFSDNLDTSHSALMVNIIAAGSASILSLIFGFDEARLWRMIKLKEIVDLLRYGWKTLGIGLSAFLINGMDILVIGAVYTPIEVAIYTGAKKVYQMISALTQAASLIIMPYASRLASEMRHSELRVAYEKVIGYFCSASIVIVLIGWAIAGMVYPPLLDGEYTGSTPIFRLMLLGAPFEIVFTLAGNFLYGTGAVGMVASISLLGLGLWLILAFVLIKLFAFGGLGAAGALVSVMIFTGIFMHLKAAREFDTKWSKIIQRLGKTGATFVSSLRGTK